MATESKGAEMVEGGLRTIPEAQEYTRLSRAAIYGLMDRGELAYTRIGKRRLIPFRALVDLAQRGLVARTAR
jgi:excisionase family DNA binding protein